MRALFAVVVVAMCATMVACVTPDQLRYFYMAMPAQSNYAFSSYHRCVTTAHHVYNTLSKSRQAPDSEDFGNQTKTFDQFKELYDAPVKDNQMRVFLMAVTQDKQKYQRLGHVFAIVKDKTGIHVFQSFFFVYPIKNFLNSRIVLAESPLSNATATAFLNDMELLTTEKTGNETEIWENRAATYRRLFVDYPMDCTRVGCARSRVGLKKDLDQLKKINTPFHLLFIHKEVDVDLTPIDPPSSFLYGWWKQDDRDERPALLPSLSDWNPVKMGTEMTPHDEKTVIIEIEKTFTEFWDNLLLVLVTENSLANSTHLHESFMQAAKDAHALIFSEVTGVIKCHFQNDLLVLVHRIARRSINFFESRDKTTSDHVRMYHKKAMGELLSWVQEKYPLQSDKYSDVFMRSVEELGISYQLHMALFADSMPL